MRPNWFSICCHWEQKKVQARGRVCNAIAFRQYCLSWTVFYSINVVWVFLVKLVYEVLLNVTMRFCSFDAVQMQCLVSRISQSDCMWTCVHSIQTWSFQCKKKNDWNAIYFKIAILHTLFSFYTIFQIVPHLKRASELNVYIILHFWYQLLFNITFIEWSETANERIERITRSALFNSNIKFSSSYSTFGGVVVVIWLLYGSSGFFC